MSEEFKWYVVHTYSGYENKVKANIDTIVENRNLQDLILETRVPTETVVEVKDSKQREVERKKFPGYVIVKMKLTDDSWYVIRNTRGVTGFVGPASKPVPLSEKEVKMLGVDIIQKKLEYNLGDAVVITEGHLKGVVGTVQEIDTENNIVKVLASMFGRETPVELEINQVKII